jgi:predicted dehydrogenase
MSDKIGVAFVGCNHPHIFHRLALLNAKSDVQVIGCYDPDTALMQQFEEQHNLRPFESAEALLDQPNVRFVIIEGWDTENPKFARLAAERGQAILLEKPGAPNLAEMQALVADLRKLEAPFKVGYQLRFSPIIPHVERILSSGVLGAITLARFHAAAPVGAAREPWQSVPGDVGGVVYTDGCHMIDLIVHLLGVPRRVQGKLLKLPAGQPVLAHGFKGVTFAEHGETVTMPLGGLMYEDAGTALLEYDDKLATFDLTGWEANPWVETWRIELFGANGTLYACPQPPWYRLFVRDASHGFEAGWHSWEGSVMPDDPKAPPVNVNYAAEMDHMLGRVRTWDTDNTNWLASAEAVVAVLDAIYRSDREDRSIEIAT